MIIIQNGIIVLPGKLLKNSCLEISGDKISRIGKTIKPKPGDTIIDACGAFVSPGFIDTHIHGSPAEITANETKYGTTSFVIAVSCGRPIPDISGCENALGVRLEGPYINPKMTGAQDKRSIRPPSVKGLEKIIRSGRGKIRMITLAPELPNAYNLIKACIRSGVIPSIGHSDADYTEAKKAFSAGIRHVTHIFNAVSGPRHGSAGASMAALFDKRVAVEVIADMKHVEKDLLRLLIALKNNNSIILITDSVRAKSSGHKKGSTLTMIDAVRNMVKHCGVSLADAVKMASLNPAAAFGVSHDKGSIHPGKDADIAVFDKNFDVKMTVIHGRIVYLKELPQCAV
jgi:N-acetylglucosamine-6-phosphate deacetylase